MNLKFQIFHCFLLSSTILFSLSCSIPLPESLETAAQDRDMSQYDQGGIFNCNRYDAAKSNCDKKKFHEFIWQHWTEKKRGYLESNYNVSPDASHNVKIFIEPEKNGQWHIAWIQVESYLANGKSKKNSREFSINSVEKVKGKTEKDDWSLLFKDGSGEKVENPTDFYF